MSQLNQLSHFWVKSELNWNLFYTNTNTDTFLEISSRKELQVLTLCLCFSKECFHKAVWRCSWVYSIGCIITFGADWQPIPDNHRAWVSPAKRLSIDQTVSDAYTLVSIRTLHIISAFVLTALTTLYSPQIRPSERERVCTPAHLHPS